MRLVAILFLLFLIPPSFAEDSMYDLDLPPELIISAKNTVPKGTSNEVAAPKETAQTSNVQKKLPKKIKGFNKKKKKQKPVFDAAGGYSGTLPNVKSEFSYKTKKPTSVQNKGESADNFTPEEFQKSRIDDPLFLDVILNKEKPSQYVNDMIKIMRFLESFRAVVEKHEEIQRFNANVNLLDLQARRIEKLYSEKPEGMSPSYYALQDLAYKAKILGNLKYDANYYSKFSPISGTQYSKENIDAEDAKFLIELDKTVFQIRQLNN